MVERSPEKAGVGGSTPSLATIFAKNLRDSPRKPSPQSSPQFALYSPRQLVDPVSYELLKEFSPGCSHGLPVRLCIQLHGYSRGRWPHFNMCSRSSDSKKLQFFSCELGSIG